MVDMIKKAMLVLMLFSSFLLFSGFTGGIDSTTINAFFSHGTGGY